MLFVVRSCRTLDDTNWRLAALKKLKFANFTRQISIVSGHPSAFAVATAVVILWSSTGWLFGYSDTWQLVINTSTTIVTFLMVFVIQSTQNRDTEAIQIKLDELIRATKGAHNALLDLEELDEEKLDAFRRKYEQLAAVARGKLASGTVDTDSPEV